MRYSILMIGAAVLAFSLAACSDPSGGQTAGPSESLSSDASVMAFSFSGLDATCAIDEESLSIAVGVRWNANLASLAPTIVHTGASISPASGIARDFTGPVAYTVTAQDGSSRIYTVTVTRREYGLGGTGPAGGTIFYVKAGADPATDPWKYLEAAPISTQVDRRWSGNTGHTFAANGTGLGTGKTNTAAIAALLSSWGETGMAAQYCDELVFGAYGDWYLPTYLELKEMTGLAAQLGIPLDNSFHLYWSSSTISYQPGSASCYAFNSPTYGSEWVEFVENSHPVRAIRSF